MENQAIIDQFQDVMMKVKAPAKTQSGFYLQQYGVIVTSAIGLETTSAVKLFDKSFNEFTSRVLYWDTKHDLTFLEVPDNWQGPVVPLGDPSILKTGDKVVSVGFEPDAKEASMSGEVLHPVSEQEGLNYICVNADMHYGNAGGPLVNDKGEVIGVNSEKIYAGYGYGYGLPLNYLQEAFELYNPHFGKVAVRCQYCDALALQETSESEQCPSCQEELTFPDPEEVPTDTIHVLIEKAIRQAGKSVNDSKVQFEKWAIQEGKAKIDIIYSFNNYLVIMESVLAKEPADKEKQLALNKFLLEENGRLSHISFSKSRGFIMLGAVYDEKEFDVNTGTQTLLALIENADRHAGVLIEKYGCTV